MSLVGVDQDHQIVSLIEVTVLTPFESSRSSICLKPGRVSIMSAPETAIFGDDLDAGRLGIGRNRLALSRVAVFVGADIGRGGGP